MKCQNLFSEEKRKYFGTSSAEFFTQGADVNYHKKEMYAALSRTSMGRTSMDHRNLFEVWVV